VENLVPDRKDQDTANEKLSLIGENLVTARKIRWLTKEISLLPRKSEPCRGESDRCRKKMRSLSEKNEVADEPPGSLIERMRSQTERMSWLPRKSAP
jgi:hypothetical protein